MIACESGTEFGTDEKKQKSQGTLAAFYILSSRLCLHDLCLSFALPSIDLSPAPFVFLELAISVALTFHGTMWFTERLILLQISICFKVFTQPFSSKQKVEARATSNTDPQVILTKIIAREVQMRLAQLVTPQNTGSRLMFFNTNVL